MLKRSITGIILGITMISGLLFNFYSAISLLMLIAIFSCIEWRKSFIKSNQNKNIFLILSLLLLLAGTLLSFKINILLARNIYVILSGICIFQILFYLRLLITNSTVQSLASILSGILYIILPSIACIFFLKENFEHHRWIIMSFIGVNWANDSMAYFGGRLFGKTPLAPRISPKKTIEGSLTGLIFGTICLFVFNYYFHFELENWKLIILALLLIFTGSLGDLFESSLKRYVEIKDSGNLLPGHGGFLDRFDSFYFVLPIGIFFYNLLIN